MVTMPYLLTAMVDLSTEACPVVVIYYAYDNETSFRSEIDHSGQQIWHLRHFQPLLSMRASRSQKGEYFTSGRHDGRFHF